MKACAYLALALMCSTADCLELKGVRLGMTLDELMVAFPAGMERPGKPRLNGMSCLGDDFCTVNIGTLAGVPTELQVTLRGRKVVDAYAGRLAPSEFDQVAQALKEKFGTPTSTEMKSVQNRMGNTFPNPCYVWKFPEGQLAASRFMPGAPTLDISQVEITSPEWLVEKEAKKHQQANDL